MGVAYEIRDRRISIVGLSAPTADYTHVIPAANSVSQFATTKYVRTDSSIYTVTLTDQEKFTTSLYTQGDAASVFSDGARYSVIREGAEPYVSVPESDPVDRVFIKESRISAGTPASDPPEWAQGAGVTAEAELPRGLILAHELTGAGWAQLDVQGQMLLTNGQSGTATLRIYTSSSTNPAVALGSATLRATHTVTIADPAGGSTLGDFHWRFMLMPCGDAALANIQIWRSLFSYRRHGTDPLIEDKAGGQLSSITSPTAPDFHSDTIFIPTTQKSAGWSNGRLLPYSMLGVVRGGESGAA